MSAAAMAAMPSAKAGIASGVLAMNRVFAGALALAITGGVFQALQRDRLTELLSERGSGLRSGDAAELEGLLAGSQSARRKLAEQPAETAEVITEAARETYAFAVANAFWVIVGLIAAGTVLTWLFVRDPETAGEDPALPPAAELVEPGRRHHFWHHRRFHL